MTLWSSPEIRYHLQAAGRALVSAVEAAFGTLQGTAATTGLADQYPYLPSVLQNLQQTLRQWTNAGNGADHDTTPSARSTRRRTVKPQRQHSRKR